MISADLANFFLGSVGASAALIGLLFVSIATAPERVFGPEAPKERWVSAESAFTALVNAFFISLGGLIPGRSISGVVIALSISALLGTLGVGWRIWRARPGRAPLTRSLLLLFGSLIVYGLELWNGILIARKPNDDGPVLFIVYLLFSAYGISLARAWELLGARRKGLLTGLMQISDHADDDVGKRDDVPSAPRPEESGR